MLGFNRLHNRIMLPFITLFLVINLAQLFLYRYSIGKLIDGRTAVQADRLSRLVSNSEFVLNPAYLARLRHVIDSDIVVLSGDGGVAASTVQEQVRRHLVSQVSVPGILALLESGRHPLYQAVVHIDRNAFMLTARLTGQANMADKHLMLWVISPMSDAQAAKTSLAFQMGLVSLAGILMVFAFGHLIARSVTRPVSNLVTVTRAVADGQFDHQAFLPPVAELRQLAQSINTMSARLTGFKEQVARSSRLAAAGKVTAAMSHEIRNPMSSIKMLAQLLRDRPDIAAANRKIVQSMLEEITRVERIVEDLSELARPSNLILQPQDITNIIQEVLVVLGPKLIHRKIDMEFEPEPDLPDVSMDKDRIKQVIWNLLLNAMESMPLGGKINVRAGVDADRGWLRVVVEDEGCGFDQTRAEEMYAPFFTTKPEGLGLGLSTSKEIMAGHDGELVLENRRDRGVRAVMTLPLIR